ncbi:hypothetical protein EVC23_005 [Rhizobium phage RHph_N3_8]|uniref:hypothetical protein n=1 Tax=Rhizobium phage RHph_N3_8 TaxID=2509748 RepID=UPI001AF40D71|nr:hypothetical protein QEJ65_gp05 [Rhizobium phage RHph_N3_8]QIG76004.1 hypothetical protein EVC23_005 [Rhizobium phage RHph_N3_8]
MSNEPGKVFYIIREEPNSDETVMANTFDTYIDARKELTYNLPAWDESGEPIKYRIDNAAPSPRTLRVHDFTVGELFPQFPSASYTLTCTECACEVKSGSSEFVERHASWHNKLLP